ncbi:MAG: tail fiber domain-containing protein [Flavobacteriales bacterium]|nr:tail fiber domain-containing protein [Flavobacteriales bacterium]
MMRRLLFVLFFAISLHHTHAQLGINANGVVPAPSAMLDLNVASLVTKKGLLVPRMPTTERAATTAPAQGAVVYETTTDLFWHFNGTAWVPLFGTAVGWSRNGNGSITPATHFLGTTDAVPLEFRRNNARSGWLSPTNDNTSWGYLALGVNTGTGNSAFGERALRDNSTGVSNTATGASALERNTTGSYNVAVGFEALGNTTATNGQTAIGVDAISLAGAAPGCTAIGLRALNGVGSAYTITNCTAVGYEALQQNIGASNTACGENALRTNSTGVENTAVGSRAMYGSGASASTGLFAFSFLNSASNITGFGSIYTAGGSGNTTMGYATLSNLTNGTSNTALGHDCMIRNTSGDQNTALGHYAMNHSASATFVNQCTAVGHNATTADVGNNQSAIGYNAISTAPNVIRIGNAANNTNLTGGYGTWQNLSDARFKRDVREDVPGLPFIIGLRPVTYRFDVETYDTYTGLAQRMREHSNAEELAAYAQAAEVSSAVRRTGFIAQEVDSLANAMDFEFSGVHRPVAEGDHYTIGYEQFVVPLVKAVQQQQAQLDAVRAEQQAILVRLSGERSMPQVGR